MISSNIDSNGDSESDNASNIDIDSGNDGDSTINGNGAAKT